MKFDENLIMNLNRKGFRINNKFSQELFELITNNNEFYQCSEQLLLSKGIKIQEIVQPTSSFIQTYYHYSDETNFERQLDSLIDLLNSNKMNDYITNTFEGIFVYIDYILNIDIIELIPSKFYSNFDKFYCFDYQYENNHGIFWNSFILSYIVSKKMNDAEILLNYKK